MIIKKTQFLWFWILLLTNMPAYLYTNFRVFSMAMALTQYLLLLYVICMFFSTKGKAFSKMYWMLIVAGLVEYIASLKNPLALPNVYLKSLMKSIGVWGFMDQNIRKNGSDFLKVYGLVLSILITLNLATIILFPSGMYTSGAYTNCFFLGYDNTHIVVQLPALCVLALIAQESKQFHRLFWMTLIIVIISQAITFSVTSIVGVAAFVVGLLLLRYGKEKSKLRNLLFVRPLFSFAAFGAVTTGLVSGSLLLYFQDVFLNLFHKDATLSSRTRIWLNSLQHISQRPLWGYGYEDGSIVNSQLVNVFGQTGWGGSSHNTYLWILFLGGVILFAVVTVMFAMLDIRVGKFVNRKNQIIKLWIFVVLLMGLVESHYDGLLFTALIVGYNFPWQSEELQ